MQVVGYKRAKIQILDKDLKPVSSKAWTIEGTPTKGATSSFEITGLTKEATKIYGSNIPYLVFRKGVGNVAANLGFLDLPFECEQEILGYKKSANGVVHIGDETEAPFCAVLFESEGLNGEKIGFGLYAGTIGRDGYKGETLNDDDFNPEAGEYVMTPIMKKFSDGNHTVGIAADDESFKALETELFGTTTVD